MSAFVQNALRTQISTPLGPDRLFVRSYRGEESISGLFRYDLELYSQDSALDATQILGKSATLKIQLSNGGFRYVNGIVGRFAQAGRNQRFTSYTAVLRPWLWLMSMSSDCRIFQNKSALDIVKQVFSDLGFTDFQDKTTGTPSTREYCVQYRETAFDFVSRLLEEEGVSYYFTHEESKHTMVLADDTNSWGTCEGLTTARYAASRLSFGADDAITECSVECSVTVGEYKSDDFNFTIPATELLATATGNEAERTIYEYPGLYSTQSDGETVASRRLASLRGEAKLLKGSGLCRAFLAGAQFTLANHYRDDFNASYVIRSMAVQGDEIEYSNSFQAFPADAEFRPPLATPRPLITGLQTATVVGKAGEEIWTDEYGRVVVQFHWDQQGQNDEKSSCWIRVAQGWAGSLWGSIFIPRVGQEVVVSFLEGNPDRPLITGAVFNAQQQVPYALPDEQTKSTIKTSSSKGGSGFNELRFEDKAGSEEIFVQAQKDMNVSILNNSGITVTGTRTVSVTGNESHINQANYTGTTSGNYTSNVSGNYTLKIEGNLVIEAGGSVSIKSGTDFTNTAGTALTNKAGTDMTNDAGVSLTNKAAASQTVDGGGMLTVKGGLVKIN